MAGLVLKLTDAGLAAVQAAAGSDPVVIAELGLTNTPFDYAPTLTGLPGEFKRIGAVSGVAPAANIAHLTAYDTSADTWTATGLGLYLDDGTLFAVHASDEPVQSKASLAFALISIDIIFNADLAANIAFGNAIFTNPPATTEMRGLIELATLPEAQAGLDKLRALTPEAAALAVTTWLQGQDVQLGVITARTPNAGTVGGLCVRAHAVTSRAIVQFTNADGTAEFGDLTAWANGRLEWCGHKIWTAGNDGAGSGLDADLLDGQDSSYFTNIPARLGYTPVQQGGGPGQLTNPIRLGWSGSRLKAAVDSTDLGNVVMDSHIADVWRASNDGSGSSLDADLLDGQHGSYYTDIVGRLGFRPVRQGGGPGQLTNTVDLGWSGARLKAAVDGADQGNIVMDGHIADVWRASNDGSGSGLDADLFAGSHASEFVKHLDFALSSNAAGYVRLPNGFILQWVWLTGLTNRAHNSVTFPISFPNLCLATWATLGGDLSLTENRIGLGAAPTSNSGGTITVSANAAGSTGAYLFAIGN